MSTVPTIFHVYHWAHSLSAFLHPSSQTWTTTQLAGIVAERQEHQIKYFTYCHPRLGVNWPAAYFWIHFIRAYFTFWEKVREKRGKYLSFVFFCFAHLTRCWNEIFLHNRCISHKHWKTPQQKLEVQMGSWPNLFCFIFKAKSNNPSLKYEGVRVKVRYQA